MSRAAFKIRNALSVMTLLSEEQRLCGVVTATRGNHGQGVALAGRLLGVPVTVCVPVGNNPEKNRAMRGFGAELIEQGRDYDEALEVAKALVRERGLYLVHSTRAAPRGGGLRCSGGGSAGALRGVAHRCPSGPGAGGHVRGRPRHPVVL